MGLIFFTKRLPLHSIDIHFAFEEQASADTIPANISGFVGTKIREYI